MKNVTRFNICLSFLLLSVSCSNEFENLEGVSSGIETKAGLTKASYMPGALDASSVLRQLDGIPFHIWLPEGSASDKKMYLGGVNKSDKVKFFDTDDASGRHRWNIKSVPYSNAFTLEIIGGANNNYKYLSDYIFTTSTPYPSLANYVFSQFGHWHFGLADDKWLMSTREYPEYQFLCNEGYGKNNPKFLFTNQFPQNNNNCRFVLAPVEEFKLESVRYVLAPGQSNFAGDPVIDYMRSYPVVNNTEYDGNRELTVSETYRDKSTFSQTKGLTISHTVTASTGLSFSVPKVTVSGSIQTTDRTDHTFSFTVGREEERTLSFVQTVTVRVPAFSKLRVWVVGKRYSFGTNFIGTFRGVSSSRTINLEGNWMGVQMAEVEVQIVDETSNLLIGTINEKGEFREAEPNTFFDTKAAMQSMEKYKEM